MSSNLPAVSHSKGIQQVHTRRIQTVRGPRNILINKDVKKQVPVKIVKKQEVEPVKQKPKTSIIETKKPLPPKERVLWTDVMKWDDGTNLPISVFKPFTRADVVKEMDIWPTRNEEDFYIQFVDEPINEINNKVKSEEITEKEAKEELEQLIKDANSALYDDEAEPSATIVYQDGADQGQISSYTNYNAEGIDIEWIGSGYRGYYDVVLSKDSEWEILHEDNVLSGSHDSENLKKFDEMLIAELEARKIGFARVVARSSNIFSQGYTVLVEKGNSKKVIDIKNQLASVLRRQEDYDAETNPLRSGTDAAKEKGLSREQIEKMLESNIKSDEVRQTLKKALDKTYKQ